ncbi:MAG: phage major capsid protein [Clostridia bacterium]
MDPELMKAIEDLQKSWADYRKTNDERLAAIEKGQGVSEINAKLARIDAEVAKNQKLVDEFTALQAQVNRMNLGTAADGQDAVKATREFNAWAHDKNAAQEFRASATSGSNPDGGFAVIPELESGIDRVAETMSVMRQLADVKTTGASVAQLMVNKGGASGGWVDEIGTRSETDTAKLDLIQIPVKNMYANPLASEDLIDDASFDVAAWLEDEAGIVFGEYEGAAFISGNLPSRPRGILAYDTVANASFAWGKVGYIATGTSGAFDSTNPADKIISLQHALKAKYRNGAVFLMNDGTLSSVRQFKNSYGYLWQPSLVVGQPSTLLGAPVYVDDNMPDVAANSFSIAFGNFKRGYAIRDRAGIKVLRDPYSTKGFVEFYTTKRVGGGIRNFEAIKLLKFAAS